MIGLFAKTENLETVAPQEELLRSSFELGKTIVYIIEEPNVLEKQPVKIIGVLVGNSIQIIGCLTGNPELDVAGKFVKTVTENVNLFIDKDSDKNYSNNILFMMQNIYDAGSEILITKDMLATFSDDILLNVVNRTDSIFKQMPEKLDFSVFEELLKNSKLEELTRMPEIFNFLTFKEFSEIPGLETMTKMPETLDFSAFKELSEKFQPESLTGMPEELCYKEKMGAETDDTGKQILLNGRLLPNIVYIMNGFTYKTDKNGNIIKFYGTLNRLTADNKRNAEAQQSVGGESRLPDDQGGHLIARIFGGSSGIENLTSMRNALNLGPYKVMENEIRKAIEQGKEADLQGELIYDDGTERPSQLNISVVIDGVKKTFIFDNNEGSTAILDSLKDILNDEMINDIQQELQDIAENSEMCSLLAAVSKYDEDGNLVSTILRFRNETTDERFDRILLPKEA